MKLNSDIGLQNPDIGHDTCKFLYIVTVQRRTEMYRMIQQAPDKDRLVRLPDILAPSGPIPVSKSTWWANVAKGIFPAPVKLGPRATAWRWSEIQKLIDGGITK